MGVTMSCPGGGFLTLLLRVMKKLSLVKEGEMLCVSYVRACIPDYMPRPGTWYFGG